MEFISSIVTSFNTYAKDYPIIAGGITLWGLGTVSYICRGLPQFFLESFKRLFTTTVTLTSSNDSFYSLLRWFQEKGYDKKARFLKITNGRWGSDNILKSVGYGSHILWVNKCPIYLKMIQKDSPGSDKEKDEISVTTIGRSHKTIDNLFKEIIKIDPDKEISITKRFDGDYWEKSSEQRAREFNTVYLRKEVKETLIEYLNDFEAKEDWYIEKGVPYQIGILLYGPPGTGKTSIIKAIASHLGYQLHILNSSMLGGIGKAIFSLPEKSLIVIEDIDGCEATKSRSSGAKKGRLQPAKKRDTIESGTEESDNPFSMNIDFATANISDILNAIDGIHQVHGRILVATTNYAERLDDALLREGRFDLKIEIGYADNFIVSEIFKSFYPVYTVPETFSIREEVSTAYIQGLILKNLDSPDVVLNDLQYKGDACASS